MSRKHDCIVNGTDVFLQYKNDIGRTEKKIIELDGTRPSHSWWIEKGAPVNKDWYPVNGKCEWRYEIDGLWSSSSIPVSFSLLVVIMLTVIIGVLLIAVIVFTIMVLKRRNESRQKLGESLVADPASVLCVSFQHCDYSHLPFRVFDFQITLPEIGHIFRIERRMLQAVIVEHPIVSRYRLQNESCKTLLPSFAPFRCILQYRIGK